MNSKILVALVSVQTIAIIGLAAAVAMLWLQVEELPTRDDVRLLADEQTSKLSEQIQTVGYLASTRSSGPSEYYFDRQLCKHKCQTQRPRSTLWTRHWHCWHSELRT